MGFDKTLPPIVDPQLEIARLNVPGSCPFFGFGEVTISGASNNVDVWSGFGKTAIQPEPDTGGYALWVESDSGDDVSVGDGTGVQQVLIHYLDTAGAQQSTTVIMAGVTPVDSGVADCMFVQVMHASVVGTGLVAAGNIDATKTSGGAVVSRILAAGNYSLSTMRQVPAGTTFYIYEWHCSAWTKATKENGIVRLRSSSHFTDAGAAVNQAGVYLFKDTALVAQSTFHMDLKIPIVIPALATVKVSVWTSGDIDNLAASYRGVLDS